MKISKTRHITRTGIVKRNPKKWTPKEGTPFVIAQALYAKNEIWNKQAREWLLTYDGKKFYNRLTIKDKNFLNKAFK